MSVGAGVVRFTMLAMLALTISFSNSAFAQSDANRRQQMFEQLLDALIQSQMSTPNPRQELQAAPVALERVSPQLREVRQVSRALSDELSRLFEILNQDMRLKPNLSIHFNSTLQVNAHASILAQRSERVQDLNEVKQEFTDLDREWRQLAYQLNTNASLLSQNALTSIRNINTHTQRLSTLFGVNAQIDSQKFQRLAEALELGLRNLMDDISMELGWTSETRQLLVMGRMVEQQTRYIAYNTELHRDRERCLAEYNKFQQLWGPFSSQLWPLKNRYIERNLQRIEQIDREMQETLLIPIKVDHRQLARIAEVLQNDTNTLFQQTTLAELVKLKSPEGVLKTSKDLQNATLRLIDSAKRNREIVQLQTDFRMVDHQWKLLVEGFEGCESPEILRLLKSTEQTVASLKTGVQIRSSFDRVKALQLIAALENFGKHLQEDFSSYVVQGGRYDRGFTFQGLHTCHQFTTFSNNIHQSLADGADPAELRERVDILARGWNYLNTEFLMKLQGAERVQLSRLAAEITPNIVQLQTMFEF